MDNLQVILASAASRHSHLCPRQVLGARLGLAGAALLGFESPVPGKRMMIIAETDGCFVDGLEAATGCSVGHRTLRIVDYGKIGATFIDVKTEVAYRLAPRPGIRQAARQYAPDETRRYFAQLHGYQVMPDDELFTCLIVHLDKPVREIISRPNLRHECEVCGEEIFNERQVMRNGQLLCLACAGQAYYQISEPVLVESTLLASAELFK